jgi:uncharacterized membrane protein AbrB (regulator of aidB expression)
MVDSLLDNKKGGKRTVGAGRLLRTILLGALVVAFAVYWLADSYGVDPEQLLEFFKVSIAFVAVFALAGVIGGILLLILKRFRNR